MTSLNAGVIAVCLVISVFIQRLLSQMVGEAGIAKIGSLRNLTDMLQSFSSVGFFSGVVKYVAEYQEDKEQLQKLFSTVSVFVLFSSITIFFVLFFGAGYLSETIFETQEYLYLIRLLAVMVPLVAMNRIYTAVVNGLSRYKKLAGIDLVSYLRSEERRVGKECR